MHGNIIIWVKRMECNEQQRLQASVMKINSQAKLFHLLAMCFMCEDADLHNLRKNDDMLTEKGWLVMIMEMVIFQVASRENREPVILCGTMYQVSYLHPLTDSLLTCLLQKSLRNR